MHCKAKHSDSVLSIAGYTLHRRDRQRRRGGGVAVYVRSDLQSTVWTSSVDDWVYELHWQWVGDLFIGAMYHPPRPLYTTDSLLNYIEACVDEINCQYPSATIVLQKLLPEHNSHSYSLRPQRHNFILATKTDDRNFVTRQLFTNIYWTLLYSCFYVRCTQLRFVQLRK